jgi:hypothetical protein
VFAVHRKGASGKWSRARPDRLSHCPLEILEKEGVYDLGTTSKAEGDLVTTILDFSDLRGMSLEVHKLALDYPFIRYQLDVQASFAIGIEDAIRLFEGSAFVVPKGTPWLKKCLPRLWEEEN